MTDYSKVTAEECLPDAKRYCARDGRTWIMRRDDGRFYIINPYSKEIEDHYLEKLGWTIEIELTNGINIAYTHPTPSGPVEVTVDDAMVKRAEDARMNAMHGLMSYGSAGVTERYEKAMRAALTAALAGKPEPFNPLDHEQKTR